MSSHPGVQAEQLPSAPPVQGIVNSTLLSYLQTQHVDLEACRKEAMAGFRNGSGVLANGASKSQVGFSHFTMAFEISIHLPDAYTR
jgi:hypothetical protein